VRDDKPNPNTITYPLTVTNFIGQWFVMDAEGRALCCSPRQFHAETIAKNMNAYANVKADQ
jgi:hypothetical protein